eukprot:2213541-Prymnesium_polylepis.1
MTPPDSLGRLARHLLGKIPSDTSDHDRLTGMLVGEDPVLEKGSTLTVHTDEAWREKCDKDNIFMDYKNLPGVISVGGFIFVDDGLISLKVGGRRPNAAVGGGRPKVALGLRH